ncbi:MAG TPA: YggS family pyridoxal phosphate-dependent enzyme [Chitinophagaceae bacterium]|nr:YggS family pyridoxal phosphate-dependent enzyme [Chitinophagaceae bacterium]
MENSVYHSLKQECEQRKVTLVAVSKTKSAAAIQELYDLGQRDFGENYVQELVQKQQELPVDIRWHFIGHLQSNKVKMIAPFVHLIHAVDSFKLLQEIAKQAAKNERTIDVLLQLHVADEDTKFGMDENELMYCLEQYTAQLRELQHVRIRGLMGMASFTEDITQVRQELHRVRNAFVQMKQTFFTGRPYFDTCSMGMSSDYKIAVEEGSTMVRIGSMLFGSRT